MSTMTRTISASLPELLRSPGMWTQVYIDESVDTGDPPQVFTTRRQSVIDRLRRDGAPEADLEVVLDILAAVPSVPSPMCRYLLVKDGVAVVDEVIPGVPLEPEVVSYGPVPDIVPLLKHEPPDLSYLVVETSRDGGEVRLYRAGTSESLAEDEVQSDSEHLHKLPGGGWRHDHQQNHVEEVWRQTQSELAARIDEIVREQRPALLVVAGDIRARQILENELSAASRAILSVEPTNTRADGSNPEALDDHVTREIERILAEQKTSALDLLEIHRGRGDNTVELSTGAIVRALASAQVDTLILDTDRLRDREFLALDDMPWIATAPEEALGAGVLGSVPAANAMVRAALLTDASVLFVDSVSVPDGEDLVELPEEAASAALLRWRTGPPVPGA